jgi:hypothetical protein
MTALAAAKYARTTLHRIVTLAAKSNLSLAVLAPGLSVRCGSSLIADCSMPPASDSAKATTTRRTGAPPGPLPNSYRDSALVIFALLLAFRIVNALTLRTFFQPDEFFQSLEPAWQLAFGDTSNAWITWVNTLP